VAFELGWFENAGLAAALAVLIAALAAAVGGAWAGLAVAAAGLALQLVFVHDASAEALVALPVWAAAAAVVAWLAWALRERRAERDLLRRRVAALQESTHDAVIELDAEGKVVAWNGGAKALYGYEEEEAVGRDFSALVSDDEEAAQRLLEAVARDEGVTETSVPHRRSSGETATVSLAATPIGAGSGPPARALVVARDVGEVARAHEQLSELESRYLALAQLLPGAAYIHAVGDRDAVLYASPQVGTMLGYRPEDWLGQPGLFSQLVHDEDRQRVSDEVARAAATSAPFRAEYRMLARDGSLVWVRDHATTMRAGDGEPRCVQGYLVDITAEREARAEQERVRAEARGAAADSARRQRQLDVLARASVALSASFDREAALRRIAGLAVQGLADWCVVDVVDEYGNATRAAVARGGADAAAAPSAEPEPSVMEVLESGEPSLSERRICVPMTANGRTLGAITLVAMNGGRSYGADDLALAELLARMAALWVDNARLHQQVQESADAAHVLTYVADGVFLVDRAGVIRLWNPTMETITGLEARTVVGSEAAAVIPEWQALAERIPVSVGREPVQPETLPIEAKEGERWISISGVEFFGGTVYALRDLTEVRRLEHLKAEFVATASHELRTPLAAVYGAAQTLRRHDFALDEAGRERFVSLIVDEAERLGRIVNDILLASQLDVGRLDLRHEIFDPGELIERVVEAARAHAPAGIVLEIASEPSPPAIVSDRERLRQVLVNLVENALKYSPDGGRVEVGAAQAGKMIRFYVRDEGLGIPEDEQARVFDKFYRVDPQMTGGIGGTGLGLYICDELVQRLGGRIWVESDGESGSTFLFEIPATDVASARPLVHDVLETSH
jgi:two-component system, OmpR family, phosphate regulon sensor histidine kinase PhoR